MSSVVDITGDIISKNVREHPLAVRWVLSAIYKSVAIGGHFPRKGLHAVEQRYVGHVGNVISRGMSNPEKCALVNVFMPQEITEAFGLTSLFPEGIAVYLANTSCASVFAQIAEETGVPESFCSYHKVMIGLAESGVLGKPMLVANTSMACDANQLSFRRVAEITGVPHVVVDVPHDTSPEAIAYVADELYKLIAIMEDVTHTKIDLARLRASVASSAKTMNAMRNYYSLRGGVDLPTTLTGVFCDIVATHCLSCDTETQRYVEGMVELAKKVQAKPPSLEHVPRIFWMHTLPNWQMSLRGLLDKMEHAQLVGVDFAIDSNLDADFNHPIESLARRIVTNVNNGGGDKRVERAVMLAKQANADGAIIFCHWGCKQTLGLSQMAQEAFEAEGIPALVLDGDGCDARNVSDGQMVTRVGAFLEQLKNG